MLPARLVPALALAVVAAGCPTAPDVEPAPGASVGDVSAPFDLPAFSFSAAECTMAGFVAHPMNDRGHPDKLAEVWQEAAGPPSSPMSILRRKKPRKASAAKPLTFPISG